MKLQLKRSNVLNEEGNAKSPSVEQMEYGEIAVNYNHTDPVLFIRDSADNVIRLTNIQQIGDGQINVNVGTGLLASGSNATANQTGNTTRLLSIDETWLDTFTNASVGNGAINVNPGLGISATGSNASANQTSNTTRVISLKVDPSGGVAVSGSGTAIKLEPNKGLQTTANGLAVVLDPAKALENTPTGIAINVHSGKGISTSTSGIRVNPNDLAGTGIAVQGDKLSVIENTPGDGIDINGGEISVDVSEIINQNDGLKVVNNKISVDVVDDSGLAFVNGSIKVLVDAGYGLQVTTSGLRFAGPWTNIPSLP